MTDPSSSKTKIAILGGGVGAISAAFELTSPLNPRRDEFEVTIYQMGWRIGGKGASGRNRRFHQRIEEHGLHIWMGWYHNAFRLMKECYAELGREPEAPLATWQEAFKPHSCITLMDLHGDDWKRWDITFPTTRDEPGGPYATVRGQIGMLRGWLGRGASALHRDPRVRSFLREVLGGSLSPLSAGRATGILGFLRAITMDRRVAQRRCRRVRAAAVEYAVRVHRAIECGTFADDDDLRRLLQLMDMLLTTVVGLIDEGVATGERTFNELDELELREFLTKHGCREETLQCAFLRCYYNIALAYRTGDSTDPTNENAAAGAAINIMLRACFGYRGAFMWEMQSGMGDTVFAPYFEVLRRRGVDFRFFHRVTELELSGDGRRIERVHLERQVDVVGDTYEPLIDVDGLPCWPSEPLYEQLVQGDELRSGPNGRPYDLEAEASGWRPAGQVSLAVGRDFDQVILGIPVGAHGSICKQLSDRSKAWRDMVAGVDTVATQAFQLWLRPTVEELGWSRSSNGDGQRNGAVEPEPRRVIGAYAHPFHTWADFSHLARTEAWPRESAPRTVAYFLGTIPEDAEHRCKETDGACNCRYVAEAAARWLGEHGATLWPRVERQDGGLGWDGLVGTSDRMCEERLASQYHRANTEDSERYVQHTAGTTKYRLRSDESGFDNLVLAGDWIDTGICGGCVETATMSGLQAARAISGYPRAVPGESSGPSRPPARFYLG